MGWKQFQCCGCVAYGWVEVEQEQNNNVACGELLTTEARERRKMDGDLYMYRLKDSSSKVLKDDGYLNFIGEDNIFDSKKEAISTVFR